MNKPNITIADASAHIRGYHPTRSIDPAEYADEACFLVGFQCGFEMHVIAVYGDGLCEGDAMEAAEEYENERGAGYAEATYCERIR